MDIQLKKKPWYVRHLYLIISGIIFLGVTVYVFILAFGPRRMSIDADSYRIAEVTETPFLEYVDVEGIVQPIKTIKVNTMEGGFVERIVAEEGDTLEVGDTILILKNVDLLRTIEDEHADWQNRQLNYHEQEIEMEQRSIALRQQALDAEHQMASLEKSLKQGREEFQMGIKSRAELDLLEEDYNYKLKKARLQMESLRHDSVATILKREMVSAGRDASLRKLSRLTDRTGNLVVKAPVAGQLSLLNVTLGQQVGAGSSAGEIKVLTEYKIHVTLSEYYIDRIISGLPANISYQEEKYPLRVSKVVPEVKERNFTCDLLFTEGKPGNIRLGKSYRVKIELATPETALVIPRGDFHKATSGKWIYRLSPDGKEAEKVEIELGRQNPRQFEVVYGLAPGDKVIVSGYENFGNIDKLMIK